MLCGPFHIGSTFAGLWNEIVREPGGPTVHPPPPPPPRPQGTFHYGPKMYLRVSQTQYNLFSEQALGCTGVIALCARVPLWPSVSR